MRKKLLYIQVLLIGVGAVFSSFTLTRAFQGFYAYYDTLTRFKDCVVPNPMATPCFYGTLAFIIAFVWSLYLLNKYSVKSQKYLSFLLIFGTLFAVAVISYEFVQYYHIFSGPSFTCSPGVFPLKTPCAFGGLTYLLAFILSRKILNLANT